MYKSSFRTAATSSPTKYRNLIRNFTFQPRPQGLLAFQYGGGRREGTQQKSRDWFVHGEWKFIQNGGQDKDWEDLGTRSWDWRKTNKMAAKANAREAKNMKECT